MKIRSLYKALGLLTVVLIAVVLLLAHYTRPTEEERVKAPDFGFTDINGDARRLGDFKGRVVVIDFFALWCKPCEMQMEILKELWPEAASKGVVFLSIDIDPRESIDEIRAHVEMKNIGWIVGSSPEAGVKYGIEAIPTVVVIDSEGNIVEVFVGVTKEDDLMKAIEKAMGEEV